MRLALAAANARIAELETARDSYEVALELSALGGSVVCIAESAMSSNDHWCEQADRFQTLAASLQNHVGSVALTPPNPPKGKRP